MAPAFSMVVAVTLVVAVFCASSLAEVSADKCFANAGFSWCESIQRCVRPFELTAELGDSRLKTVEGFRAFCAGEDKHAAKDCLGSAGYTWCAKLTRCVRPWELRAELDNELLADPEGFASFCAAGGEDVGIGGGLGGGLGGDADEHGCLVSAGYGWCGSQQRCLRPWELAAERLDDSLATADGFAAFCALAIGSDKDAHQCIASAGYRWCAKTNACARAFELGLAEGETFESRCNVVVGSDLDTMGCIASAGYRWCYSQKKCIRPWELALGASETVESFCSSPPSAPSSPLGSIKSAAGCITSAGYRWCTAQNACVRPWELGLTATETFETRCAPVALQTSPEGCPSSAGYLYCQVQQRCVRPWELMRELGDSRLSTSEGFAQFCNAN